MFSRYQAVSLKPQKPILNPTWERPIVMVIQLLLLIYMYTILTTKTINNLLKKCCFCLSLFFFKKLVKFLLTQCGYARVGLNFLFCLLYYLFSLIMKSLSLILKLSVFFA
uniref:Uncharacterized protein n=1 Tax=Cacopsylla melanoneura TaxID=428564 RepID=A0A8D9B358_9HEMI